MPRATTGPKAKEYEPHMVLRMRHPRCCGNRRTGYGAAVSDLPLTGERTIPGLARENYWFRRHEVAYEWVTPVAPAQGRSGGRRGERGGLRGRTAPRGGCRPRHRARVRPGRGRPRPASLPGRHHGAGQPRRPPPADRIRRGPGLHAGHRAPLGPPGLPRRLPPGAAAGRVARRDHPQPPHLLPRAGPRREARPTRSTSRSSTPARSQAMLRGAGSLDVEVLGLRHGAGVPADIVERQVAAALADDWPPTWWRRSPQSPPTTS